MNNLSDVRNADSGSWITAYEVEGSQNWYAESRKWKIDSISRLQLHQNEGSSSTCYNQAQEQKY